MSLPNDNGMLPLYWLILLCDTAVATLTPANDLVLLKVLNRTVVLQASSSC